MRHLLKLLHRIEDGLLVAVLFLMIGLSVLEIILRNFFGLGLVWIEPVLQNGVLWIALLGAMVGSRRDEQIRIDIASHYLPEVIKRWLSVLIDLVTAGICAVVAWYSAVFVFTDQIQYGGNAFAGMPSWILQAIIPVGFTMIGLRYLVLFCLNLAGKRPDFEEEDRLKQERSRGEQA